MTEFDEAEKFYELIRERVCHEDTLYNQRITWLISMQAFLFASLGLILRADPGPCAENPGLLHFGIFLLVAVTGILVALVSNNVLTNGRNALNDLTASWDKYAQHLSDPTKARLLHPRGQHTKRSRQYVWRRGLSTGNLPAIFVLIWLGFIALLLFDRFEQLPATNPDTPSAACRPQR